MNKILAKIFVKVEKANIETNTKESQEIIENVNLDSDEKIFFLDIKSLYTNVPLEMAIDIALKKIHEPEKTPDIARITIKRLLNLAVGQVHFKCNDMWYAQKDGLAVGASLAVILVNLRMEEFGPVLRREFPKICNPIEDLNDICPESRNCVTYRQKGVECEICLNLFHQKCGKLQVEEFCNIANTFRFCSTCCELRKKN